MITKSRYFDETMNADTIRLIALNLPYKDIINTCVGNKRLNSILCDNDLFQKQYGLKYLTAHEDRLPVKIIVKNGEKITKYDVIRELDMLKNLALVPIANYIGSHGYEKYIINNLETIQTRRSTIAKEAAKKGYFDIVNYLLRSKLLSENEHSVILESTIITEYALKYGNLEAIKYIYDNNARFRLRTNINSAVFTTAENGRLDMVKYLVEKGAEIDYAVRGAASNGQLDIIKYTMNNGTDLHVMEDEPLILSASEGHLDTVKYLVENGAPSGALGA